MHFEIDGEIVKEGGVSADIVRLAEGSYSILVGTKSYSARVFNLGGGTYQIELNGRYYSARALSGRSAALTSHGHEANEGRVEVRSPMPGKIVKVLAAVGGEVAANQPLLVIEAMKMQNELRAPRKGRIGEVRVAEGQVVATNTLLLTLE